MGKRKHKRKTASSHHKPAAPAQSGPPKTEPPADAIAQAVLNLRGRRACALCGQAANDPAVAAEDRVALVAAAHETYIRELLDYGHADEAAAKARSLRATQPELCDRWALSLRVRLGLVDDAAAAFDDPAWREQLRHELVDPADLADAPAADAAADARTLLDAWQLADDGHAIDAKRKLAAIGRRSLLVDWRLFLQGYMAARDGRDAETEAALKRVTPGTPAAHLAARLRACQAGDTTALADTGHSGPPVPDTAAMHTAAAELDRATRGKGSIRRVKEPFKTLVGALLAARRPAAANCVMLAVYRVFPGESMIDAGVAAGIPVAQVGLCCMQEDADTESWIYGLPEILRLQAWQPHERAILLLRLAAATRHDCEVSQYDDDDDYWMDAEDDQDRAAVAGWCREVTRLWPELPETYPLWRWAEADRKRCRAEQAETRAFPDKPEAWCRLIRRTAELAMFKGAEKALAALARLPGADAHRPHMEAWIAYCRVIDAFDRAASFDRLVHLAEAYAGADRFEQVGIAVRLWLRAPDRKTRRQYGEAMAALGAPWLVAFFCDYLSETGTAPRALPAAVQRALTEQPGAVAENFLALAQRPERLDIDDLRRGLLTPLLDALAHPDCPIPLTADTLRELVLARWHGCRSEVLFDSRDRFMGITARLLTSGDPPTPAAICALALRALLYSRLIRSYRPSADGPCTELLQAAARLAHGPESRAIIQEVADLVGVNSSDYLGRDHDAPAAQYEAVWRRQCAIRNESDLNAYSEEERTKRGVNVDIPPNIPAALAELINTMFDTDMPDDFEDDDEYEDWEPDTDDSDNGVFGPPPDIDLAKCHPISEIEFEQLIERTAAAEPAWRRRHDDELKRKIDGSALSEKARERLQRRFEQSRRKEDSDARF